MRGRPMRILAFDSSPGYNAGNSRGNTEKRENVTDTLRMPVRVGLRSASRARERACQRAGRSVDVNGTVRRARAVSRFAPTFNFFCCEVENAMDSMNRRDQVSAMMAAYWDIGHGFEVRGPLAVAQVEHQMRAAFEEKRPRLEKQAGRPLAFEDMQRGQSWNRLKEKHTDGDELFSFESDERSWPDHGVAGYALIRTGEVVHVTWTRKTDSVCVPVQVPRPPVNSGGQ